MLTYKYNLFPLHLYLHHRLLEPPVRHDPDQSHDEEERVGDPGSDEGAAEGEEVGDEGELAFEVIADQFGQMRIAAMGAHDQGLQDEVCEARQQE